MNLSSDLKITRVMNAVAAGATNQTSSIIDMQGFEGVAFEVAFGAITGGAVTGVKVQQGNLSNGSDMADLAGSAVSVPDTASNKVVLVDVVKPTKRYVRVIVTRATANAVIDNVSAVQYDASAKPVTQDSSVVASKLLISAVEGVA